MTNTRKGNTFARAFPERAKRLPNSGFTPWKAPGSWIANCSRRLWHILGSERASNRMLEQPECRSASAARTKKGHGMSLRRHTMTSILKRDDLLVIPPSRSLVPFVSVATRPPLKPILPNFHYWRVTAYCVVAYWGRSSAHENGRVQNELARSVLPRRLLGLYSPYRPKRQEGVFSCFQVHGSPLVAL